MSGPGLNQRDAHHAIHQAAFAEAEQLTLLLRRALRSSDQQRALQVAAALIEHWQTRTLHHAEAEETGWYREVLAERPERQADVSALWACDICRCSIVAMAVGYEQEVSERDRAQRGDVATQRELSHHTRR